MAHEPDLIKLRAVEFAREFNQLLSAYPRYRLDGEWLSLGVVDSILFPLRGLEKLSPQQEQLLFAACCYMASIVRDCWKEFPGSPVVGLFAEESPRYTLRITLRGGGLLRGAQEQSIDLFEACTELLAAKSSMQPVYREFSLRCFRQDNVVSPFVQGICSGASPFTKGPLLRLSAKEQMENELPISLKISESIARTQERLFPLEKPLYDKSVYLRFAGPPPDYDDGPPLLRNVLPAWVVLDEHYEAAEEKQRIAKYLARSSDDMLSKVGTTLCYGMCQVVPHGFAASLVEAKGLQSTRLRHAVHAIRLQQGFEGTWSELYDRNLLELAQHYLCLDMQLGLSPLLVFPVIDCLYEPAVVPFLRLTAAGDVLDGRQTADLLSLVSPVPPGFILQVVKNLLVLEESEAAVSVLSSLTSEVSEFNVDMHYCVLTLRAEAALQQQNVQEAIALLEEAVRLQTQDYRSRVESVAKLSGLLLKTARVDLLEKLLEYALVEFPDALSPRMFSASLHIAREELELAETHCAWLYKTLPNYPEAFSLIQSLLLARL